MADGFTVQDHLSPAQVDGLLRLYGNEWWTKARTRADVERMLSGTDLLFGVIDEETDTLAAFARVLSDGAYLAIVLDVIRGAALSEPRPRAPLDGVHLRASDASHVGSIELVCQPELIPFYQQWGFSEEIGRSRLMRRTSNPLLKSAVAQQAAAPGGAKRITRRSARSENTPFLTSCFLSSMRESITASRGQWDEARERAQFESQLDLETTEVVRMDEVDVGFVMLVGTAQELEIHTLCVLRAYQGRGIGSRVTINLVTFAQQTERDIVLSVLRSNSRAEALYRRLGFTVVGESEHHRHMKHNRQAGASAG